MPDDTSLILDAAQRNLAAQENELATARDRQIRRIVTKRATGSADIDQTFSLNRAFRLVFVRGHFSGPAGTAALRLSLDSGAGTAYDAHLFTVTQAGTDKDVHLRIGDRDMDEPSPWTFDSSDAIRFQWTNPDSGNITWGLEIGLSVAST